MFYQLLETSDIDLQIGAGIHDLTRFLEHFRECKLVVYTRSNYDSVLLQWQTESDKRINLLFDEMTTLSHHR